MQPKDRLIFPLDVPNKAEAEKFIELLRGEVRIIQSRPGAFYGRRPAIP